MIASTIFQTLMFLFGIFRMDWKKEAEMVRVNIVNCYMLVKINKTDY